MSHEDEHSPANQLDEDVLLVIFQHLDAEDLLDVKMCAVDGETSSFLVLPGEDCFIGKSFRLKSGEMFCEFLESAWRNWQLCTTGAFAGPSRKN